MTLLSMVHAIEVQQGKREGRGDTSQGQNWSNFRNAHMDKVRKEMAEDSTPGIVWLFNIGFLKEE